MALLHYDGFDHYGNGVDLLNTGKWQGIFTSNVMQSSTAIARTGTGSAMSSYGSFSIITKPLPASGGFVLGFAVRFNAIPNGGGADFVKIFEGGSSISHLMISTAPGPVLVVKNGSGTVLATGTTVISANNWYYFDFKGVIHDTTGSFELRIDGTTEPNCLMTGVDTRNGGTGQWDRVGITSPQGPGGGNTYFDDFYACDMSGPAPYNDFLGPVKIETLMAQPGNGSNVGLTPSTGTDHGALVDEVGGNTTDYNSSATVGAKDTYNLPSLTVAGAVLAVQTVLYAAKSDAGARKVCAVFRTGGVDYDGVDLPLLTSFTLVTDLKTKNPGTGLDWTTADITALEAGMKVTV